MKLSRRNLIATTAAATAAVAASKTARAAAAVPGGTDLVRPGTDLVRDRTKLVTPNGVSLESKLNKDGVRVFHLVAQPVQHEFAPGLQAACWGYNGRTPGPTIEMNEGEPVRVYVTNQLPEPTSVHWHAMQLKNGMDGVAGLTQPSIKPGETFRYEFTPKRAGTYMYHPHDDEMTQMALGMMGLLIVHPRRQTRKIDRDFAIMLGEWRIKPGTARPDPIAMSDFNVLTMNSKVFPAIESLVVKRGERVRIRLGNLSAMEHHPIHIHGTSFVMTATDGGPVPESAQHPETSILVPVGTTRDIEFVYDENGDWPMHCHMTHHTMTQMGHDVENLVGVDVKGLDTGAMIMSDKGMAAMNEMTMPQPNNTLSMVPTPGPFGPIGMGGMFTIIKVRDDEAAGTSWYQHPEGTVARKVTKAELEDDLR
jgi:FtsP/CotA-like multicopper oxidase with cupredoxin domain